MASGRRKFPPLFWKSNKINRSTAERSTDLPLCGQANSSASLGRSVGQSVGNRVGLNSFPPGDPRGVTVGRRHNTILSQPPPPPHFYAEQFLRDSEHISGAKKRFSPQKCAKNPPCNFYARSSTCILARVPSFLPIPLLTHLPLLSIINHGRSSSPSHPSAGSSPQRSRYCPCRHQQHCALYSSGCDVDKGPHYAYQKVGQSWASAFWLGASVVPMELS